MADIFSVVALVGGALLFIFIVVCIIFFNTTMNNQIPLTTQSTAMFWLGIIWAVLLFAFMIWAFVRLFMSPVIVTPNYYQELEMWAAKNPEAACQVAEEWNKYVQLPQSSAQPLPGPIVATQTQKQVYVPGNAPQGFDPNGTVHGNQYGQNQYSRS